MSISFGTHPEAVVPRGGRDPTLGTFWGSGRFLRTPPGPTTLYETENKKKHVGSLEVDETSGHQLETTALSLSVCACT